VWGLVFINSSLGQFGEKGEVEVCLRMTSFPVRGREFKVRFVYA
jgi:hypothetical protein